MREKELKLFRVGAPILGRTLQFRLRHERVQDLESYKQILEEELVEVNKIIEASE